MNDMLRKLQLEQLDMLILFDRICSKHNLNYSLYAGTLLGAVRHSGFIPWDDDLDVCMSREDYDKFIAIWATDPPNGYILQNKDNSPNFTQTFSKIRKDSTTFLQDVSEIGKYHTGIFIDIFPLDRMPKTPIKRAFFKWNSLIYLLLSREFVPHNGNPLIRLLANFVLFVSKDRQKSRLKSLRNITKYNNDNTLPFVSVETVSALNINYSNDLFNSFCKLEFENREFMCFKNWDIALRLLYGDYMSLPPKSERVWKHHPVMLDFNNNYQES